MTDYMHPGYRKPYPIPTVLRDLASQEGCDGEPYDAMVFAAARIEALEAKLKKAVDCLRYYAVEAMPWDQDDSLQARTTLDEIGETK